MKDKKRYSEAFKLKVMEELRDGKWKTVADAATAYGVHVNCVRYWMKRLGFEHLKGRIIYVKTATEIDEIKRAMSVGLYDIHSTDGYVFFTGGNWKGFNNSHPDNEYSYLPCPVHTKEAYEKMEEEKRKEEEEQKRKEEEEKKKQEEAAKATDPSNG